MQSKTVRVAHQLKNRASKKRKTSKKRYRSVRKKRPKILMKSALVISTFFFLIAGFSSFFFFSYIQARAENVPEKSRVLGDITLASKIYDRQGELLMRFHDDRSNRDKIETSEITNEIRAAYLAAEDAEFYNHNGVNLLAIVRCAYDTLANGTQCGGSTITQQVVKIQTERDEVTLERKIDEALTAVDLEKQSTKEEILTQYLNTTPYGSNITGIETAAKVFFGLENASELRLDQAVTLAAIINDPVGLAPLFSSDPETSLEELKIRRNYIFEQLKEKQVSINEQLEEVDPESDFKITDEVIADSQSADLGLLTVNQNTIKAGHFVSYVMEELQKRNYYNGERPFTLAELQSGGFEIYTTLDYDLQKVAEKYANRGGTENIKWNVHNAAVMTTRPSTGEIITMAGSRDYRGTSEGCDASGKECLFDPKVNVLTSLQSPGSTNKSLGYYIAYEQGKTTPGGFLPDIPIKINNYVPKNWDNKFMGANGTTARDMLRLSRNIPALLAVTSIGYDTYIERARDFGYTSYGSLYNYGPSIILGGGDVYPLEHAQGYGVFANQGDLVPLNPIMKIVDSEGNTVYERKIERKRVADPGASFLINESLLNLDTGIGESISWDGRQVAGKTGTTENNIESWLVMYSPEFVTVGWAGNNNNQNLNQLYGWPAFVVAPWLRDYMAELGTHEFFNGKAGFSPPSNVSYGNQGVKPGYYLNDRPVNFGVRKNGDITEYVLPPGTREVVDRSRAGEI